MSPEDRPLTDARPARNLINKHLGIKPTSTTSTAALVDNEKSTHVKNKADEASELPGLGQANTTKYKSTAGRFQGYGNKVPYAAFCADYDLAAEFPETTSPLDGLVDVQTVAHVNVCGTSTSRMVGGDMEEVIKVRVPGADHTTFVVVSRQKTAYAPGLGKRRG